MGIVREGGRAGRAGRCSGGVSRDFGEGLHCGGEESEIIDREVGTNGSECSYRGGN